MKALFREVNYQLSKLLAEIEDGDIGLPEIQRPFVWSRTKVRDLFDSMYRVSRSATSCSGKIQQYLRARDRLARTTNNRSLGD
jgi:uncharacterized protein with ParB-like and HNH nuclease domain